MAQNRFLIAPFNAGWVNNVKPWLIPDDAYSILRNAYVYENAIHKRFGTELLNGSPQSSRLRVQVATVNSNAATATVPGGAGAVGQAFSVDDHIFTVNVLGTPATLLDTGTTTTKTFNTSTGVFNFSGFSPSIPNGTPVYWYPALPVMALPQYGTKTGINEEPTIAFDTRYAYNYIANTGWDRISAEAVAGDATWSGDNADFHWATTFRGSNPYDNTLFVVNGVVADSVRYYNGTQWATMTSAMLTGDTGITIQTAKIVIAWQNRLWLLNTQETDGTSRSFPYYIRSSGVNPLANGTFDITQRGLAGGLIPALYVIPNQEEIVSVSLLRDRMIIYCEKSTFVMVPTGNQALPFRLQQINSELGAESRFSTVNFDKAVLGIGNVGVHACNGASVERIDQNIWHEIFKIHNLNDGPTRVYGIRDYFSEQVYWSYPSSTFDDQTYPDKIFVYNYSNGAWAQNDDSFTCFGYFQNSTTATWGSLMATWGVYDVTWGSGYPVALFPNVITGNQEGWTSLVNTNESRNAPSLQVTNITFSGSEATITAIDHNLKQDEYVYLELISGFTPAFADQILQVIRVPDTDTVVVGLPIGASYTGTYIGGGLLARVSQVDIWTKQYNFFLKEGYNIGVNKIDFLLTRTENGEFAVDYYPSSSELSMISDGEASGALLGTNKVETYALPTESLEKFQTRVWHSFYTWAEGNNMQFRFYFDDVIMRDPTRSLEDFELHAVMYYAEPAESRLT